MNKMYRIFKVLASLSPREYEMMAYRYGFGSDVYRTLEETGKKFGVTRERIRQIEAKIEDKIRYCLEDEKDSSHPVSAHNLA